LVALIALLQFGKTTTVQYFFFAVVMLVFMLIFAIVNWPQIVLSSKRPSTMADELGDEDEEDPEEDRLVSHDD
jgi:hypothetical protein